MDSGDTAWVLSASALVLLMTPALALFYGGFMPGKRVLSTMLLSWACFCLMSILWPLFTYSLAFGPGGPLLGGLGYGLFDSSDRLRANTTIPEHAFCAFQMAFAVVTAAVVSGSVAGRITLPAWCLFCVLWHIFCYVPLARWVFYPGGWLAQLGLLDFAGGLVVETNSGVSGLVLAALVGWQERRQRDAREGGAHGARAEALPLLQQEQASQAPGAGDAQRTTCAPSTAIPHVTPHSVPLILLGSGLLCVPRACWVFLLFFPPFSQPPAFAFTSHSLSSPGPLPRPTSPRHFGWLGFNAGSALTSGYSASRAFLNTHVAAAAGILGFALAEVLWGGVGVALCARWGRGRATAVGAATGVVVGLVAITPACGFISPMASLGLGIFASLLAFQAEHHLPRAFGVWDTLNAFSGHGLAGMVGTLAVGVFARQSEGAPVDGLVGGGGGRLLAVQLLGVCVAVGVAAVGTALSWGAVVGVFRALGQPVLAGGEGEGEGEEGGEDMLGDWALSSINSLGSKGAGGPRAQSHSH